MSDISQRRFSLARLLPLVLLGGAGIAFIVGGGRAYLNFGSLAANREWLTEVVAQGGVLAALGFILAYAALVALSVPGGMLFTIASGFLFGPWLGTAYALIGATLGASVVFLAARAGLAGLAERAGPRARGLEAGFREDAFCYLLVLRLVPIVPFWLINLAAGATRIGTGVYVVATFIGMIPGAFVYATFGNGLGTLIESGQRPDPHMLFRPSLLLPLIGLAVLALVPVIYKRWRDRHGSEPT